MTEPMLHVRHMRQAKLCMSGGRVWFAARGWSWSDFVAEGRPIADFVATGDPLALKAVVFAEKEAQDGRLL